MPAIAPELLKATEAAVVASVSLRDVNRVIDERILAAEFVSVDDGRHLRVTACPLIAFYFASASRLTAEERLAAIAALGPRLSRVGRKPLSALAGEDWVMRDTFLAIDLGPFVRSAGERMDRLTEARDMVEMSPGILGGAPVIRGTRVPVHDVAASVAAGLQLQRIIEAYPSLDSHKVALAAFYVEANPLRGRPRTIDLPKGVTIVTDRRASRRKAAA
jgi:uncharacterized protein (DUF433 family)